jgi:hypothetical protein
LTLVTYRIIIKSQSLKEGFFMKSFKRITAIVLAFVIIALTLPTISVFADDSDRHGIVPGPPDHPDGYPNTAPIPE